MADFEEAKKSFDHLMAELNPSKNSRIEEILQKMWQQKQQEVFALVIGQKKKQEEKIHNEKKQAQRLLDDLSFDHQNLQKQMDRNKSLLDEHESKIKSLKEENHQ